MPVELVAGPCLEVWAVDGSPHVAIRRFRAARREWMAVHGVRANDRDTADRLVRGGGPPWSFHYLAEHNPELLARVLRGRGLPPDWRPVYVEPGD